MERDASAKTGTRPDTVRGDIDLQKVEQYLRRHVRFLCDEIGVRSILTHDRLCLAERYVHESLQQMGYEVERQAFRYLDCEVANLIARDTRAAHLPGGYILCAHYDSVPGTPGADDNASGVAVLLETARLARALGLIAGAAAPWRFIAFTTEEPPAFQTRNQGSRVFARRARKAGECIDGVVNLEMVGHFSDAKGSQHLPFPLQLFGYPRTGSFIAAVGNWKSRVLTRRLVAGLRRNPALPVECAIVPERGYLLFPMRLSDHSSFWDHGYPAVMLTDTAFFRNPWYHTARDTPEKLNFAAMTQLVRSLLFFFADLAGNSTKTL